MTSVPSGRGRAPPVGNLSHRPTDCILAGGLSVTCYQDRHKGKGPMKRPFSEAPRGYGEAALPSRLDFRPSLR